MNNEPVSKAKDRFPNYESICLQCGTTIYKPVKELTDEEIEEVIKTSTIKISGLEAYDYCYPKNYRLDEKLFARAILKRAQEK